MKTIGNCKIQKSKPKPNQMLLEMSDEELKRRLRIGGNIVDIITSQKNPLTNDQLQCVLDFANNIGNRPDKEQK